MILTRVHKTVHILKKSHVLIVKSHQTCLYSKKTSHLCQSVPRIESETFDSFGFFRLCAGLVAFHYQKFWFIWVYAGLVNLKSLKPAFLQKPRIDTLHMFFLFYNIPYEKETHKVFQCNENLPTTWTMIIETFKRGTKHKNGLAATVKAYCRNPKISLKTDNKIIRYVTVSPHKITHANFPLKTTFYLKR